MVRLEKSLTTGYLFCHTQTKHPQNTALNRWFCGFFVYIRTFLVVSFGLKSGKNVPEIDIKVPSCGSRSGSRAICYHWIAVKHLRYIA